MNRREFLSMIVAAPLAATLAPLRVQSGVIPKLYLGIESFDGNEWHVWNVSPQPRRYTIIYGS